MIRTNCEELEKLLEIAENELDWNYSIWNEPEMNQGGWRSKERNYVILGKYSPQGEDFNMTIFFDKENPVESFLENLKDYEENFDVDDHVEMWLPERGKGGCPGSIKDLVDDARAIKEMIFELWNELSAKNATIE